MADDDSRIKSDALESNAQGMNLKEEHGEVDMDTIPVAQSMKLPGSATEGAIDGGMATPQGLKAQSRSPMKIEATMPFPAAKMEEEIVGGDIELKIEPGKPLKLQRKSIQKIERRPPPLFSDYENKTREATSTFAVLEDCTYANKSLGTTEHALECDCAEEWDSTSRSNHACGEDSDCINRATKMECVGDCGCGTACQNQRFQQKQWVDVAVIKTEKKGYGLRTETNLKANDFIYEYIGEVIGENAFRKRMQQYDDEGIKHFYFMSLNKGEFVDATKKGNLGRFCNHSCNPNCYVDKWVVGDRLRMGIFAERKIQAGEELTFNYNVDRYGAEPQPCYCGEPNCTGYIGGKTQTERGTKLSNAIIEALGIDDVDAWDTAVAKRPRKKKASDDDEEYVNNIEPRGLDEEGVNKVMSSLMQCKEKWIAVKLLTRIQRADDEKVRNRVVRFHGYRVLKTALSNFIDDVNVCLQVLDVLDKMPRLTRNKIQDSKIEETVQLLVNNEDERVAAQSRSLLDSWSRLEIGYRIPRMKRDPNASAGADRKVDRVDRREGERRRSRSRSKSRSPERLHAPTGPRSNAPQRTAPFFPGQRPASRFNKSGPLPQGWQEATAPNGSKYYYNAAGTTTWQRPTGPAASAPPPPPKAVSDQQIIQDLIKNIVSTVKEPSKSTSTTATPADTPKKSASNSGNEEKWRSLPEDKQKKVYEATLQPHVMHVVSKFKHKLAKEDLKRWAKEFAKKVVESDFKKGRVDNPSKISEKQAKGVRKHAQEFFDKAVKKKEEAEKKRGVQKPKAPAEESTTPLGSPHANIGSSMEKDGDGEMSDHEADGVNATPAEGADGLAALKRRRETLVGEMGEDSALKKLRLEGDEDASLPPPPPPPPPPVEDREGDAMDMDHDTPTQAEFMTSDHLVDDPASLRASLPSDAELNGTTDVPTHNNSPKVGQLGIATEMTQTATPPTTGSPDEDEAEKIARRVNFDGMNPDRMRQLGLLDGAAD